MITKNSFILIIVFLLVINNAIMLKADTKTTHADGWWKDSTVWNGALPSIQDTLIINHRIQINAEINFISVNTIINNSELVSADTINAVYNTTQLTCSSIVNYGWIHMQKFVVNGSVINNGRITGDEIYNFTNVINKGTWWLKTYFSKGSTFSTDTSLNDFNKFRINPSSTIVPNEIFATLSGPFYSVDIDFDSGRIDLTNGILRNSVINNTEIYKGIINSSTMSNIKFIDTVRLEQCNLTITLEGPGHIILANNNVLNGAIFHMSVTNYDSVNGNGCKIYKDLINIGYWNTGSITVMDSIKITAAGGSIFKGALSAASPGLLTEHGFTMEGIFDFSAVTLYSWRLHLKGGKLRNAIIEGANIYHGTLENCIVTRNGSYGATSFFHDSTIFLGKTIVRYDIDISGTLIIYDSLLNDGLGLQGINVNSHYLELHGRIINNGTLYNVALRPHGDIENNNIWTNLVTDFRGSQPRTIWLAPGKLFRGEFAQTLAGDSAKTITVLTDVTFGGTVNLAAGAKWIVSGQTLSTSGGAIFYGGVISGNVILKKFKASSPVFKDGNVIVNESSSLEGASFYSTVTNNDSVKANNVSLYNDLQNNKWWDVYATSVKESLSITAGPGSTFGANLTLLKDGLRLSGEFDFQYYDFGGFRAYGKHAVIKNALQINTARLHGGIIEGSLLRAASELFDSITFRGTTKIRSVVNIGGWLLNKDSLIADPSEGNVEMKVDGDIVNHGTMLGVPVSVTGDIINHGEWTEKTTNMTGSNPRRIFLASGKIFPGEMNRVSPDSVGILYALSDLRMSPGKWLNMDKGTLVANRHSLTVPGVLHGKILGPVRFVGRNYAPYFLHVQDSLIVSDSLFLNGDAKIFGPIMNQGVLESNSAVSFYHSIENKGEWKIPATKLYVKKSAKSDIRLWNTTGSPFAVQQPTLTGDYPERFAIVEGNQTVSVPAGGAHQIAVRYVDTNQITYHQAQLNIPSTGIGTLSTVMLYGDTTGSMLVPLAAFNANTFQFGQVKLDSMYTQRLIIRNPRANQLRIDTAFTKGGIFTAAVLKRISENNDSAVVAVVLVPKTFGLYGDTLIVMTNAFPYMHKFALSAAAPQPNLSVTSGFFQFPQTAVGDSTQMLVKLKNNSLNTLTIDSIRHPKPIFHLLPLPSVIGPNDSVTVVLWFRPAGFGIQQDSVKVFSNGGVAVIRFTGESPFPSVSVSSLIHSFGQVKVKDTATTVLKLKNASLNSAAIQSIVFRQQMYSLADTPKTIGRNDSIQLTIRFIPVEFKAYNDTLSIVTNGGNFFVLVNGSSPKPNLVSVLPQLTFGSVIVDSTRTLTFRMTNTSINTVVIDSARTGVKQFKMSGISPGATIGKNDTVTVSVSFTPDSARSFSDTAKFFGNSAVPVVRVALTGSGNKPTWVEQVRDMLPTIYALYQNYPNPFNPSTTIVYALPAESRVRLTVFNLLGQQVAEPVNEIQAAGWKEVRWNGTVSGIYFYRIDARSSDGRRFTETKRMVLVR